MKLEGVGVGVVGPPRSGTSSAALYLEKAAFHLGAAQDISAADEFNPDGYREHREINALNRETDWMFLLPGETHSPLPETWEEHPLADQIIARTQGVFRATFGGASYWAWKDPRTTRLLPIYKRALEGINVGYLAMVRHPASCARSIARRDRSTLDVALGIWIEYTLCALKYLAGANCRFVHEAEWLENPTLPVTQLMDYLGVDASMLALDHASVAVRSELRSKEGETPSTLGFAERCYEVAYEAASLPAAYRDGRLNATIEELWNEWQAWREIRNARREKVKLNLETDRGPIHLFAGPTGPPWRSVVATFEAGQARLLIQPLGASVFIRCAMIKSDAGPAVPLQFAPSAGASCGWSPDGACRICPWTNEGVPIVLPRASAYVLRMQVQGYFSTTSAIVESMSRRR